MSTRGERHASIPAGHENGVQISLKLPALVYEAVRGKEPSMQNFIVESIKKALKSEGGE